jgi:flagellar hook-associated protein 1 FlgK
MSKILGMMDMGKRSMQNSQTALQTVSHNIANKSTEGYSRQRVDMKAQNPIGFGKLRIGDGARSDGVSRINNSFMEKQIEKEGNIFGQKEGKAQTLARVEQVFNEQLNKGVNKTMGDFFNSFRELSNNPESLAIRNLVKESAQNLANDFRKTNNTLKKIQDEADYQITVQVSEFNGNIREIANLNERIRTAEVTQLQTANDERDRRDQLVKELSSKVNIRYGESKDGQFSITAGNNAILVSGSSFRELSTGTTAARTEGGVSKREGNADIFYKATDSGTPINITRQLTGGSLGGVLEVRDAFVNDLIKQVDNLAHTFAKEVNTAHSQGFDRYSQQGNAFFEPMMDVAGASEKLSISESIAADAGKIAAAGQANSPGDNRIANVISSLQYQQVMGGESTFDDFYNNIVGTVGVSASRANHELTTQKDSLAQLKNLRESISGVSLDEETAKMIEYQKMFEASARMIRTSDEMLETVLNLKPM